MTASSDKANRATSNSTSVKPPGRRAFAPLDTRSQADVTALLVLRGVEGLGFLMTVTPGPSLIRRIVLVSVLLLAGAFGLFLRELAQGQVITSLVGYDLAYNTIEPQIERLPGVEAETSLLPAPGLSITCSDSSGRRRLPA